MRIGLNFSTTKERASDLEISLTSINSKSSKGVSLAGIASAVRRSRGIQISGAYNSVGSTRGVQLAGMSNRAEKAYGIQIAGMLNNSKKTRGIQIAGIANDSDVSTGIQIAGAVNDSKSSNYGIQIAGGINMCGESYFNRSGFCKGIQIAAGNGAKRLRGVQVGLYNVCGNNSKGVQIGLLNRRENAPWYAKIVPGIAIRS